MRISIEGNVGSGKSTLLKALSNDWTVYPEPVEKWGDLLELFYSHQQRWALTLNIKVLLDFVHIPESDPAGRPVIVERSPMSCKEVFSRLNYNEGTMTDSEWTLFCDLHKIAGWTPDVVIYLLSPPSICMDRMKTRARQAESGVSQDYLSRLAFAHLTMLKYYSQECHVVDSSQEPEVVLQRVKDILRAYDTQIFADI